MTNTTIQDQIAELAEQGRRRIAELNEAAAQEEQRQIDARRCEVAIMWEKPMAWIWDAIPVWMHDYLSHPPDVEPEEFQMGGDWSRTLYNAAHLDLPGLAVINAYGYNGNAYFDVPVPSAEYDEYGDDGWYVKLGGGPRPESHELVNMDTDIAVAVAIAQDTAAKLAEVEEEVRRRNAEPWLYDGDRRYSPHDDKPWSSDDPYVDPPEGGPGIGGLGLPSPPAAE